MRKIIFAISIFLLMSLNCCALNEEVKYYKTTELNGKFFAQEITEKEYNSVSDISLMSTSTITEYKMMKITQNSNSVTLTVQWKKTPKYKSYDVIAIMGDGVVFTNSTLDGIQLATLASDTSIVNYNIATQNTKIFNNGLGISMNLVDDAIRHSLTMTVNFVKTGSNPAIYGNYRHATENVSLSTSKDYTIGLGTINFNNGINSKYDSIQPVKIFV